MVWNWYVELKVETIRWALILITYIDSDGNEVMGYSEKEDMEIVPKEDEDTIEDIDKGWDRKYLYDITTAIKNAGV